MHVSASVVPTFKRSALHIELTVAGATVAPPQLHQTTNRMNFHNQLISNRSARSDSAKQSSTEPNTVLSWVRVWMTVKI